MWGCFLGASSPPRFLRVFPTHVGVFLVRIQRIHISSCLPHACGGVSSLKTLIDSDKPSSPRMWGCFFIRKKIQVTNGVFPTHVGVFLTMNCIMDILLCLPHACGGVSSRHGLSDPTRTSSPRMWGCFPDEFPFFLSASVFPTHVGVFPRRWRSFFSHLSLPHACGGVSPTDHSPSNPTESSPRMWGCF